MRRLEARETPTRSYIVNMAEQEGNAQNGSSPETAEQDFTFSVQLTQTDGTQTNIKDLDQLQTAAHLTMDP